MLCPICNSKLLTLSICSNGHEFELINGVYALLEPEFKSRLKDHGKTILESRKVRGERFIEPEQFDSLPYSQGIEEQELWVHKQMDLAFIKKQLANTQNLRILDIGAHNNWLSNRLSKMSHELYAIDYFNDHYDGLGTIGHYSEANWTPIQMNLNDLAPLKGEMFDVIILNRCSVFFEDPFSTLKFLKSLLQRRGKIIVTGMQFFKNYDDEVARVEALKRDFKQKYGSDLFLSPIKGLFNLKDFKTMKTLGFEFHPFSAKWKYFVKRYLLPNARLDCHAVYDHL